MWYCTKSVTCYVKTEHVTERTWSHNFRQDVMTAWWGHLFLTQNVSGLQSLLHQASLWHWTLKLRGGSAEENQDKKLSYLSRFWGKNKFIFCWTLLNLSTCDSTCTWMCVWCNIIDTSRWHRFAMDMMDSINDSVIICRICWKELVIVHVLDSATSCTCSCSAVNSKYYCLNNLILPPVIQVLVVH